MKKSYIPSLALSLLFIGCGGGGGGSSSTETTNTTYSVTGSVPGTKIEAYCSNGSSYSTTSTNNGTNNHPFKLDLPKNYECKIVMITNEKASNSADYIITPLEFENSLGTGTYLTMDSNIDLGYVPLDTTTFGAVQSLKIVVDNKAKIKSKTYDDLDKDNNKIPDIYEDDDSDGKLNYFDEDYKKDDSSSDENEDGDNNSNNNSSNNNTNLPTTFVADDGRLLGSQCAQCHGTNGVSSSGIDSLKGEDNLAHEIYDDEPIMNAQAKGYTSTEVSKMETWLNSL